MGFKSKAIAFLFVAFAAINASAQKNEQKDSLVRLISAKQIELIEQNGRNSRRAIEATFMHNGTYLICDTALWYVEKKQIEAWNNVKVVQDETILTSETMTYFVDDNLVQCRGGVVQLEDSQHNTLRTHYLDYNTKDSLAFFSKGGAMRDSEGQIIESLEGSYDARRKLFTFRKNVNMFTDSIFIKTSLIDYEATPNRANFPSPIDFWKDGNMLSARRGWYLRPEETFFFTEKVHGTTKDQEFWSDSLYYYRTPNDVLLLGRAQVQDSTRNVAALANRIYYTDSLAQVVLSNQAAVALLTTRQIDTRNESGAIVSTREQADTLYFGADSLFYRTIPRYLVPSADSSAAITRSSEILTDPVMEYRRKAAQQAAEAKAKAEEEAAEREGRNISSKSKGNKGIDAKGKGGRFGDDDGLKASLGGDAVASLAPADSTLAVPVAFAAPADSVFSNLADSTAMVTPADSAALAAPTDSAAFAALAGFNAIKALSGNASMAPTDSTAFEAPADSAFTATPADSTAVADSLAVPPAPLDSTKIGFLDAKGNVRAFRYDLQLRCDSLRFNDLDSIARLYKNPIIWNDGNRQYSSDSIFALVRGNAVDRVSLQSNAFIITQEDSLLFDQIKATEVMAYFDSTAALRRFDALGGASAIFFLKEKEKIGTVNKVETKMMSAWFEEGNLDKVFYFDSPKNDVYPLPQLKNEDRSYKGFNWQPDLKPQGRKDITTLEIRPSERKSYEAHPRTAFKQTDIYFPGYMSSVYKAIELAKTQKRAKPSTSNSADDLLQEGNLADSLSGADSLVQKDSLALVDSLAKADSLSLADSLSAAVDTVAVRKALTGRAARDSVRAARIAARDARWAELDARDAAKEAAKQAKKDAKEKARLARALEQQRKQDIADQKKLQKYIERYRRRKAREEAAAAKKAARSSRNAATKPAPAAPTGAPALPDSTPAAPAEAALPEPANNPKQTNTTIQNGNDTTAISPLRVGGHTKQRKLSESTIDK